jgi:hypothetical protein
MTIRYCVVCKYGRVPEEAWRRVECLHPRIVGSDASALTSANPGGVEAFSERLSSSWFAPCGRKGKLWEPT